MTSNYSCKVWDELESKPSASGKNLRYKDVARISDNIIFCGIDSSSSRRCLILRYPSSGKKYPKLSPSRGFCAELITISESESGYNNLMISISAKEYNDIFTTFSENLIHCLDKLPENTDVIGYTLLHLRKWQDFMEKITDERLSPNQCKGLYGELHFIYYTLTPLIGIRAAVEYWYGPGKKQQDFMLPNSIGIEIKTTSSKSPVLLRISSEDQLDSSGFSKLYLHHNEIHEVQDKEKSLPRLIDLILAECSDEEYVTGMEFQRKLLELNYREKDREYYDQVGYHVKNETTYLVSDDFPNLTRHNLKPGVVDVKYSIDTAVLEKFMVDKDTFHESLKEGFK